MPSREICATVIQLKPTVYSTFPFTLLVHSLSMCAYIFDSISLFYYFISITTRRYWLSCWEYCCWSYKVSWELKKSTQITFGKKCLIIASQACWNEYKWTFHNFFFLFYFAAILFLLHKSVDGKLFYMAHFEWLSPSF